jgi:hypothetical protein
MVSTKQGSEPLMDGLRQRADNDLSHSIEIAVEVGGSGAPA